MFEPQPESVAEIRSYARSVTRGLEPQVQDDVVLMVSELATNALLYSRGQIGVEIDCDDGGVRVSVTDSGSSGSGEPQLQPADLLRPYGRGLRIVDELADDWGSSRSTEGRTVVWFHVDLEHRRNVLH
ncbi:MAG TPA: ATP-binding protein [Acidimicrobiales bacterium]|nr:ATP-binding protein [Acidimicrobiales bacterium]